MRLEDLIRGFLEHATKKVIALEGSPERDAWDDARKWWRQELDFQGICLDGGPDTEDDDRSDDS